MIKVLPLESPKGKREEEHMRDWQSLSHVKWICKYHIVFCNEVQASNHIWEVEKKNRGYHKRSVPPKGLGPTRRARYERSRSYLLEHPSEVQCVEYSWVYQGQKCHKDTSRATWLQENDRIKFLGKGLLCQYSGSR